MRSRSSASATTWPVAALHKPLIAAQWLGEGVSTAFENRGAGPPNLLALSRILNRFLGTPKNDPLLTLVRTVYRASVIPAEEDETDASCAGTGPPFGDVAEAGNGNEPIP